MPSPHPGSNMGSSSNDTPQQGSPLQNPRTRDVFDSIVKGRKSWKTLRGGEVVWPPELEAALIEGLENYQPDDSRETRLLGRFPMRNRFISDWIYDKTGKRRTAKQVGSRLQQLRDTCGGKRLLKLLSPNRRHCRASSLTPELQGKDSNAYGTPPLNYESESSSDSSGSLPTTPTEAHATLQSLLYRGVEPRVEELPDTVVYIDLLPDDSSSAASYRASLPSTTQAAEERSWLENGFKVVRASQVPRHIRDIDTTITLLARHSTSATSYFTVHSDEGIVASESAPLEPLDPSSALTPEGTLLYQTQLVPKFWQTILRSSDASQYAIIQRVVHDSSSSSTPIFSAMYRFNYATSFSHHEHGYPTPNMMVAEATMPRTDYNFAPLLTMDPSQDFADMMNYPKAQFFEMEPYLPQTEDWSTSSSGSADSVYASPVDMQKPMPFSMMSADDHLMASSASYPMC